MKAEGMGEDQMATLENERQETQLQTQRGDIFGEPGEEKDQKGLIRELRESQKESQEKEMTINVICCTEIKMRQ